MAEFQKGRYVETLRKIINLDGAKRALRVVAEEIIRKRVRYDMKQKWLKGKLYLPTTNNSSALHLIS